MEPYEAKLEMLPYYMREGMQLWIEHGVCTGSFLTAVLTNDFMEMARSADDVNRNRFYDYAQYLYSYAPFGCYGSPKAFENWQKMGGLKGRRKALEELSQMGEDLQGLEPWNPSTE